MEDLAIVSLVLLQTPRSLKETIITGSHKLKNSFKKVIVGKTSVE